MPDLGTKVILMIDNQRPGNDTLTRVQASNRRAQRSKCLPRASEGGLRHFLDEVQGPETSTPPFVLDCQGSEARSQGSEPCKQSILPGEQSSEVGVQRSEPSTPGFEPCGTVPLIKAPCPLSWKFRQSSASKKTAPRKICDSRAEMFHVARSQAIIRTLPSCKATPPCKPSSPTLPGILELGKLRPPALCANSNANASPRRIRKSCRKNHE